MLTWPVAFALTQVVEAPFYTVGLSHGSLARRLFVGFGASALTHPWVWFVLPPYLQPRLGYYGYVAVVECMVVLAETAYLAGMGVAPRRALLRAVLANAASLAAGFAAQAAPQIR